MAEAPRTYCMYCGRKLTAPNIAAPTRKLRICATVKLRLRNRRGGRIGSDTLLSAYTKSTSPTTAMTASPMICQEPQGYSVPPQLATRVSATTPTVSRNAPMKSILALMCWVCRRMPRPVTSSAAAPSGRFT